MSLFTDDDECYLRLAGHTPRTSFVHSPFDRRTAADREAGIFADSLIEESAARRRRTTPSTGYCSSDTGSRNKKVAARSVVGGWAVTSDTFGTIPVSSFPRGYRLHRTVFSEKNGMLMMALCRWFLYSAFEAVLERKRVLLEGDRGYEFPQFRLIRDI